MQTMSRPSSEWPQYYHHPNPYNQPSLTTSSFTSPDYGLNATQSGLHDNADGLKPTKRKSRASKRAPTTVFNADVANFRALVQQLTGCPREPTGVVGSHKGPLNINFAKGNAEDEVVSSMPYGFDNSNNNIVRQNNGIRFLEHEDMTTSSSGHQGVTTSSRERLADEYPSMNDEALDDFEVDDLCLEELAWVASGEI